MKSRFIKKYIKEELSDTIAYSIITLPILLAISLLLSSLFFCLLNYFGYRFDRDILIYFSMSLFLLVTAALYIDHFLVAYRRNMEHNRLYVVSIARSLYKKRKGGRMSYFDYRHDYHR